MDAPSLKMKVAASIVAISSIHSLRMKGIAAGATAGMGR
jgi:uncharacterized membrane protein YqhA